MSDEVKSLELAGEKPAAAPARLESIASETKWSPPPGVPSAKAKRFWFGTTLMSAKPPYAPWGTNLSLGPLVFPGFTCFTGEASGDRLLDETFGAHMPSGPGLPGRVLPGSVADLSEDLVARAIEAADYEFLREGDSQLHEVTFRPWFRFRAIEKLLRGGGDVKSENRIEERELAQLRVLDRRSLEEAFHDPALHAQLLRLQSGDVPTACCVYMSPVPAEIEGLAIAEARTWRPGGVSVVRPNTLPAPIRPMTDANKVAVSSFVARRRLAWMRDHRSEALLLELARSAGPGGASGAAAMISDLFEGACPWDGLTI